MSENATIQPNTNIEQVVDIVVDYVSNNSVPAAALPVLIGNI